MRETRVTESPDLGLSPEARTSTSRETSASLCREDGVLFRRSAGGCGVVGVFLNAGISSDFEAKLSTGVLRLPVDF